MTKIRIGILEYELMGIEKRGLQNDDDFAEISYSKQKIHIKEALPDSLYALSLMHETIHAIFNSMCEHKLNDNESLVDRLAHALLLFMVDNEEVVMDLIRKCKNKENNNG